MADDEREGGAGMVETDDETLVGLARGANRHGAPLPVPDGVRADAARRLTAAGLVTAEELAGLPLDDLFNVVATRRRERRASGERTE